MKIGYQGNHGSFSEVALLNYFGETDAELIGYPNFKDIFADVESKKLDYAVIPVENTTTGIISRSYDFFRDFDVQAIGEMVIPIREDLIVIPGTKLEEIKEIYSHPEALSQCQDFFAKHEDIIAVSYNDTAKSVEYIKECNDKSKAALGSERAAEFYDMESLLKEIQDSDTNMTRFLIITKEAEVPKEANKISIMMVLKHRPGALYNILGHLAKSGMNLLKLESRPIPGKVFEYMFYLDFEGNTNDRNVKELLKELDLRCQELKIFGCYPRFEEVNVEN